MRKTLIFGIACFMCVLPAQSQVKTCKDGDTFKGPNIFYSRCEGGVWRADTAWKQAEADEQHRKDLIFALQTRVLSDEEWKEVQRRGSGLLNCQKSAPACFSVVPHGNVTEYELQYRQDTEFSDLLFQQAKIRILHDKICSAPSAIDPKGATEEIQDAPLCTDGKTMVLYRCGAAGHTPLKWNP